MGSTRLPGKVLKRLKGRTLLEVQLDRVKRSRRVEAIIVATSTLDQDTPIAELCARLGVRCFRGSESDVLSRYFAAAQEVGATTIVRLTADCPLIFPEIIDEVIGLFEESAVDYAANTVPPESSRFPDGSDVEVFSMKALTRAHAEAIEPVDREHVTFYFWKGNHGFRTSQLTREENWSSYRLTVDYPEDLKVIQVVFDELERRRLLGRLPEVIDILDQNPDIRKLNASHFFGEGWQKKIST
jgi:spore coat polysaccharide biosynthesis protein SpsF